MCSDTVQVGESPPENMIVTGIWLDDGMTFIIHGFCPEGGDPITEANKALAKWLAEDDFRDPDASLTVEIHTVAIAPPGTLVNALEYFCPPIEESSETFSGLP